MPPPPRKASTIPRLFRPGAKQLQRWQAALSGISRVSPHLFDFFFGKSSTSTILLSKWLGGKSSESRLLLAWLMLSKLGDLTTPVLKGTWTNQRPNAHAFTLPEFFEGREGWCCVVRLCLGRGGTKILIRSVGLVYLPAWMFDFYGKLVGKSAIVPWMLRGYFGVCKSWICIDCLGTCASNRWTSSIHLSSLQRSGDFL